MRRTADQPLCRGIFELGVLWSYYAEHRKAQVSGPQKATEPFSYPNDLSFKRYYAAVEEAFVPPAVADDADDDHLFAQEDNDEVRRLFGSFRLFDLLEGSSFVDRPGRWITESELFLRPEGMKRPDPIESVPPPCVAAEFLKVISLLDPDTETGLYTKLEGRRLNPQGRALGRQSRESDEEDVQPAPFCSGCGGDGCWAGADRCRRQRKADRMRALVGLLVLKCRSKIAKDLNEDYRSPSQIAAVGKYTRESAETRIEEFLENANRSADDAPEKPESC